MSGRAATLPFTPGPVDVRVEVSGRVLWVRAVRRGWPATFDPGGVDVLGELVALLYGGLLELGRWKVVVVSIPPGRLGRARVVHRRVLAADEKPDPVVAALVKRVRTGEFSSGGRAA